MVYFLKPTLTVKDPGRKVIKYQVVLSKLVNRWQPGTVLVKSHECFIFKIQTAQNMQFRQHSFDVLLIKTNL